MIRIFIVTSIIFFIPSCVLGTISPVVVRLTLKNLENAGNVIGKIYALSTLGAIIGTFVTGFFLISWMGTRTIILLIGINLDFHRHTFRFLVEKKGSMALFVIISLLSCPVPLWAAKGFLHKISLSGGTYYY